MPYVQTRQPKPFIKICGLTRQEDADVVAASGANWCGFIFHPGSPRFCSIEHAAYLSTHGLKRVGVFVHQSPQEVLEIAQQARLDMVQLHGLTENQRLADYAALIGWENIIFVDWPQRYATREALETSLNQHSPYCAFFLLDAGTQGGGSGTALPWQTLHGFKSPRPWLLAGGLTPHNAPEALRLCSPDGLDFNSGLETKPGHKCPEKIKTAVAACQ